MIKTIWTPDQHQYLGFLQIVSTPHLYRMSLYTVIWQFPFSGTWMRSVVCRGWSGRTCTETWTQHLWEEPFELECLHAPSHLLKSSRKPCQENGGDCISNRGNKSGLERSKSSKGYGQLFTNLWPYVVLLLHYVFLMLHRYGRDVRMIHCVICIKEPS